MGDRWCKAPRARAVGVSGIGVENSGGKARMTSKGDDLPDRAAHNSDESPMARPDDVNNGLLRLDDWQVVSGT